MLNIRDFCIRIIDVTLLSINALLFLPRLIIGVASADKNIAFSFPLMLSILAYYFSPPSTYDLFRHYENYQSFISTGEVSFIRDYYLLALFSIGALFSLKANFIAFISCFILYYLWYKILFNSFFYQNNCKRYFGFYFLLYFLTPPLVIYTGVRFSTGLILGIYGIIYWIQYSRPVKGFIFLCLSVTAHFSMMVILVLFLFNRFVPLLESRKVRQVSVFIALLFLFFNNEIINIFTLLINSVNSFFGWGFISSDTYITGKWGVERAAELNSTGQIVLGIKSYGLLFLLVMFCWIIDLRKNKFTTFYYLTCIVTLFTFPFYAVFDRYATFLTFLIVSYMTTIKDKNHKELIFLFLLFIFLIFFRLIDLKDNILVYLYSYSDVTKLSLINIVLG